LFYTVERTGRDTFYPLALFTHQVVAVSSYQFIDMPILKREANNATDNFEYVECPINSCPIELQSEFAVYFIGRERPVDTRKNFHNP
jgi:hypothetical protein